MLKNEIFARDHAGKHVKVINYKLKFNGTIGRVIGFDDPEIGNNYDRVWIEDMDGSMATAPFHFVSLVVDRYSIKHKCFRLPLYVLMPITIQDDCNDCGAKNNDPCKNDCPNKENS